MAFGFFSARELPRLREISSVLIRHGLGDLVPRTDISPHTWPMVVGGMEIL